jgi:hypothetical protein
LASILISELESSPPEADSFDDLYALRHKVEIITVALQASLVSPFSLLKTVQPQVSSIIDQMAVILHAWMRPPNQLCTALDEIALPVDFSMLKMKQQDFTCWHLLQLQEKLLLLRALFSHIREMNGFEDPPL